MCSVVPAATDDFLAGIGFHPASRRKSSGRSRRQIQFPHLRSGGEEIQDVSVSCVILPSWSHSGYSRIMLQAGSILLRQNRKETSLRAHAGDLSLIFFKHRERRTDRADWGRLDTIYLRNLTRVNHHAGEEHQGTPWRSSTTRHEHQPVLRIPGSHDLAQEAAWNINRDSGRRISVWQTKSKISGGRTRRGSPPRPGGGHAGSLSADCGGPIEAGCYLPQAGHADLNSEATHEAMPNRESMDSGTSSPGPSCCAA